MILDDAMRAFLLDEPRWAVLGTINPDGSIQQSVMWFDIDGDTVLMNTKKGRLKDRNIRIDERISICVENGYSYITLTGRAELNEDPTQTQADILRLAVRYQGIESAEAMVDNQFSREERVSILLKIDSVFKHGM